MTPNIFSTVVFVFDSSLKDLAARVITKEMAIKKELSIRGLKSLFDNSYENRFFTIFLCLGAPGAAPKLWGHQGSILHRFKNLVFLIFLSVFLICLIVPS